MAKDEKDKATPDLLTEPKAKRGRPPKNGFTMTAAQRMFKKREKIRDSIKDHETTYGSWGEDVCSTIMASKKHSDLHEKAWRKFGELKEYK